MDQRQPIDIIVVTYNRLPYMKTFMQELKASTKYPFRLIVLDNGSTDGTREWILQQHRAGTIWKYIFTEHNLQMAAAFTEAFHKVESELFITTQDDIIPPRDLPVDWLEVFVNKIQSDQQIGCINFVACRKNYGVFCAQN